MISYVAHSPSLNFLSHSYRAYELIISFSKLLLVSVTDLDMIRVRASGVVWGCFWSAFFN